MKHNLTKRENQIMELFWNASHSLSANDVYELEPSLSKNTIQAVLRKLKNLNYIKVEDIGYNKNVLTRLYSPTISREEHIGFSPSMNLVTQFVQNEASLEELKEIEQLIKQKRKELKK